MSSSSRADERDGADSARPGEHHLGYAGPVTKRGRYRSLVLAASLAACDAFDGSDDSPGPAADARTDAGDAASASDAGGTDAAPSPASDAAPAPAPPGNVGTWTFATAEACSKWATRHASFTWVEGGRDGTGACRLCPTATDPGPPSAEVPMPAVRTLTQYRINGYFRAVDGAPATGQIGVQARDPSNIAVTSSFGDITPSASWAPSNEKGIRIGPDAGVEYVYAQLAILSGGTSCIDFDDVTITLDPPP